MEENTNTMTPEYQERLKMKREGVRQQFESLVRYYLDEIEAQEHYDALEDYEIEGILIGGYDVYLDCNTDAELQTCCDTIASAVVSGDLKTELENEYLETLQARIHYYKATIRATQEFEVWIKAGDGYHAEDIASRLTYHDLDDYIDSWNMDYDVRDICEVQICGVSDDECFTDEN